MLENIKQIAQRIKALRELSDMSVETMSKELGIDSKKYIEYESGEVDIPVSFLYAMAGKFNVELTALLTGEEPKLQKDKHHTLHLRVSSVMCQIHETVMRTLIRD